MRYLPLPSSVVPAVTAGTLVLLIWIGWASMRDPESLWAPGDLSRYHADIAKCVSCHEPFHGVSAKQCLRCHSAQKFIASKRSDLGQFHLDLIRKNRFCLDCHTEHRGALAQITIGLTGNPHGQFVFLATGTRSCTECHAFGSAAGGPPALLNNALVQDLFAEGEGAHQPGAFARCLRCHAGGELDIEND